MFHKLKNMGFKTYGTLYNSYMVSILNYGAAVWGYPEFSCTQVLQNGIKRFYLGVNGYAPNSGVSLEFEWLDTKFLRWLEMLRYLNRLNKMPDYRWPKIVHKWDMSLKMAGWADHVSSIIQYSSLDIDMAKGESVDLDAARVRMLRLNKNIWRLEATTKTKLRTFLEVHDDSKNAKIIVNSNLSRAQRSLTSKIKLGILPLQIEVGRWKDDPLDTR